jgi:hypothetical protein
MILKYLSTLLITWVAWNMVTEILFNRDDLMIICLSCFIYSFHIIHIKRASLFAVSSLAFVLMMIFDNSCYYRYYDYSSMYKYHYCIEYASVRTLAIYSWIIGALVAIVVVGLINLSRSLIKPSTVESDNVLDKLNNASNDDLEKDVDDNVNLSESSSLESSSLESSSDDYSAELKAQQEQAVREYWDSKIPLRNLLDVAIVDPSLIEERFNKKLD